MPSAKKLVPGDRVQLNPEALSRQLPARQLDAKGTVLDVIGGRRLDTDIIVAWDDRGTRLGSIYNVKCLKKIPKEKL
jgi:hypothetical protein